VQEIREAIEIGEIIEDYPEDKYAPSCLILGFTKSGRLCMFNAVIRPEPSLKSSLYINPTLTNGLITK
jgi:Domain of unknown function (DUF4258)